MRVTLTEAEVEACLKMSRNISFRTIKLEAEIIRKCQEDPNVVRRLKGSPATLCCDSDGNLIVEVDEADYIFCCGIIEKYAPMAEGFLSFLKGAFMMIEPMVRQIKTDVDNYTKLVKKG